MVTGSQPGLAPWQDRDHAARRTPRWRGITLLHELRAAGVPTALASDNTRDQFYAYGDLDMLEVFTQVGASLLMVPFSISNVFCAYGDPDMLDVFTQVGGCSFKLDAREAGCSLGCTTGEALMGLGWVNAGFVQS